MRRVMAMLGLVMVLGACGRVMPVQSTLPTSVSSHVPPLRTMLDGVWEAADPPIEVTFELAAKRVTIQHKGLPIRQIWRLVAEREDDQSVFLRGPKTSGGGAIRVRFLTDDVVQWQSSQETPWTLTRKR